LVIRFVVTLLYVIVFLICNYVFQQGSGEALFGITNILQYC